MGWNTEVVESIGINKVIGHRGLTMLFPSDVGSQLIIDKIASVTDGRMDAGFQLRSQPHLFLYRPIYGRVQFRHVDPGASRKFLQEPARKNKPAATIKAGRFSSRFSSQRIQSFIPFSRGRLGNQAIPDGR